MGLLSTFFRSLKMVTSGTVVHQIDTPIVDGRCVLSLRLKRDGQDGHHVVLAGISSGNYQYFPMDLSEFSAFATAVDGMKASIADIPSPTGIHLSAGSRQNPMWLRVLILVLFCAACMAWVSGILTGELQGMTAIAAITLPFCVFGFLRAFGGPFER